MSPRWHPKRCRVCGGAPEEVGPISATGKCETHAVELFNDNLVQLVEHRGPRFDHWRRQLAASVGALTPDSERSSA